MTLAHSSAEGGASIPGQTEAAVSARPHTFPSAFESIRRFQEAGLNLEAALIAAEVHHAVIAELAQRRSPSGRTVRTFGNSRVPDVVAMTEEVLRERGPLRRREILAAITDRGIVIGGPNPVKALGTILWRHRDRIDSTEEGYCLATTASAVGMEPQSGGVRP